MWKKNDKDEEEVNYYSEVTRKKEILYLYGKDKIYLWLICNVLDCKIIMSMLSSL